MRICFNGNQHSLGLELLEDQLSRLWGDRFKPRELTELSGVRAIIFQRRNDWHADRHADFMVNVTTAGSHVNNAGAFTRNNVRAAARIAAAVDDFVP